MDKQAFNSLIKGLLVFSSLLATRRLGFASPFPRQASKRDEMKYEVPRLLACLF